MRRSGAMKRLNVCLSASPAWALKNFNWPASCASVSIASILPLNRRAVSWLMSIPRSAKRSSTLRSDSGYFTYIITTRQITFGELLKYRNGSLMA